MRAKYGIFVIVMLLFFVGCNSNEPDHQTDASEDVVIDAGLEKVNEILVSENEPGISLVYIENYLEGEGEIIDFLKEYFMISDKEDLEVLTQLPLTESFFNSCLDDFDYLDEADEIRFVYVAAWLATEENVYECLVRTYDYEYDTYWSSDECLCAYSVKITLIGNQIDQVVIEKIEWNGENHTEESERREYTKEDLERAWDNRLGNYGVSLNLLSEIKVCEEHAYMTVGRVICVRNSEYRPDFNAATFLICRECNGKNRYFI